MAAVASFALYLRNDICDRIGTDALFNGFYSEFQHGHQSRTHLAYI